MKSWQHGYDLDILKGIATRFQNHDGSRPLGAFSKVKENTVAAWLHQGRITDGEAIVASRAAKVKTSVKDFTGEVKVVMPKGTTVIERAAGTAASLIPMLKTLTGEGPVLWKTWADHPVDNEVAAALGLQNSGTMIAASSEVKTIWTRLPSESSQGLSPAQTAGIVPLCFPTPHSLTHWLPMVAQRWADHYSSYNKRRSWSAASLRSFGGNAGFIEKPAEMSKKWKLEHPETLETVCGDTELMDFLPDARKVLASLPCRFERVRLMRLAAGGELTRHADITDRNAGMEVDKIARLHLPIKTNPQVEFTTWDLTNTPTTIHMAAGRWWYLDVRKPHQAANNGEADRVHLVADAIVTHELIAHINSAAKEGQHREIIDPREG
jgi:hypothetical protein